MSGGASEAERESSSPPHPLPPAGADAPARPRPGTPLARLCHELETPLGVAVMAASLQGGRIDAIEAGLAPPLSPALRSVLADLRESSLLLADSLDRCVDVVARHHGRPRAKRGTAPVRLGDCLRDAVRVPLARFGEAAVQVTIELDAQAEDEPVNDPGAWQQLLGNLIANSVLHGFRGRAGAPGRIAIRAACLPGGRLGVHYGDDGVGLPEPVRAALQAGRPASAPQGGSGLGMVIAREVVDERLHGRLDVLEAETGAAFSIEIPRNAHDEGS